MSEKTVGGEVATSIERSLLEQVRALTPAQQQTVLDFAAFLRHQSPAAAKERIPGLHPGAFVMSDDFDEPLPDSFWLGEE
ncbi:DUF2281 domain-containing protein [Nodosilinea nodulosa]|uniref:DUF2281 domain-containing protein n=1 Tax=Nodosilinea nodulosa TaxID=416001 RepID=UPI00031F86CD|nr:DUF2281 domain-containing protein [Nodosilinea nodulosa]